MSTTNDIGKINFMSDIDDFFFALNRIDQVSEEDQKQAVNYLESIDAFARTTYKSLYVIDYKKKRVRLCF